MGFGFFAYSQPRQPFYQKPDDTSKIYKHNYENAESFQTTAKFLNYFHEMLKFFPSWEQKGYASGAEGDLTELLTGFGKYDDAANRGYKNAGKLGSGWEDRYGDWHHSGVNVSGKVDGTTIDGGTKYWGYGMGETGGNLDWNPAAYETNFFEETTINGLDKPIDVTEYAKLLAYDKADESKYQAINTSELTAAKSFMKGFGDVSFYEFALKGIDKITFSDNDDDGKFSLADPNKKGIQDSYDASACNFAWKGKKDYNNTPGLGAYYVMLNLLEARRRIFYAAATVFGSHRDIGDNSKMIGNIDNFFDNTVKGASQHNFRLFAVYFAMQHAFRSIITAFSADSNVTGNLGGPGYIYSAKDRAGLNEFSKWMTDGIKDYKDHLKKNSKPSEADRVEWLEHEFRMRNRNYASWTHKEDWSKDGSRINQPHNLYQPYSMSTWDLSSFNADYATGWDAFSPAFQSDKNATSFTKYPENINPITIDKGDYHKNYTISQLIGLNKSQMMGYTPLSYKGKSYDLYRSNWVVHLVGRFLRFDRYDKIKMVQTFSANDFERERYRVDKNKYLEKKEEYEEEEYEEQRQIAIAEARSNAKRRNHIKKEEKLAVQRKKRMTAEEIEKMKEKIKQKFRMAMFSQMTKSSQKQKQNA